MNLVRIIDSNLPDFKAAYDIYKNSFPIFEQRNLKDQIEVLSDKEYFFEIVKDDEKTVLGLLLTWRTNKFIYVEHLAILESARGKNIGTDLLKYLKEMAKTPIILEIDPPIDEISIRRKGFYEKLGFVMGEFNHIHPPFTDESSPYLLKIMSNPSIDEDIYNEYFKYLIDKIMHYSFSRKR